MHACMYTLFYKSQEHELQAPTSHVDHHGLTRQLNQP